MVILGEINYRNEVTFPVTVRDGQGNAQELTATLDTGFYGFLTLPQRTVDALGLIPDGVQTVVLGDDTQRALPRYQISVQWAGREGTVTVLVAGDPPLIGMSMIRGCNVVFQATDGGPAFCYR